VAEEEAVLTNLAAVVLHKGEEGSRMAQPVDEVKVLLGVEGAFLSPEAEDNRMDQPVAEDNRMGQPVVEDNPDLVGGVCLSPVVAEDNRMDQEVQAEAFQPHHRNLPKRPAWVSARRCTITVHRKATS